MASQFFPFPYLIYALYHKNVLFFKVAEKITWLNVDNNNGKNNINNDNTSCGKEDILRKYNIQRKNKEKKRKKKQ